MNVLDIVLTVVLAVCWLVFWLATGEIKRMTGTGLSFNSVMIQKLGRKGAWGLAGSIVAATVLVIKAMAPLFSL